MLFLTEKIHRKISAATPLWSSPIALSWTIRSHRPTPMRAGPTARRTRRRMANTARKMLRDQNRRYVFGLIQKYRELVKEAYSERRHHRHQRRSTPHAVWTPGAEHAQGSAPRQSSWLHGHAADRCWREATDPRSVGDYVSIYDFQRAVADGATRCRLFYENRGEAEDRRPKVSERIAERIEAARQTATLNDPGPTKRGKALPRAGARLSHLTSPTRLEKVAQDFVDHFHQRWRWWTPAAARRWWSASTRSPA